MRAPRSHCFSSHMNNRHLWQLKKSKSWGPFWSYQLNSTANPAHLPQSMGQMGLIGSAVQLVGPKQSPRILIFSNAMGAKPSFILSDIYCYQSGVYKTRLDTERQQTKLLSTRKSFVNESRARILSHILKYLQTIEKLKFFAPN